MLTWTQIEQRLQGKSKEDVVVKHSLVQIGELDTEIIEVWHKNKRIAVITPSQKEQMEELGYKIEKL